MTRAGRLSLFSALFLCGLTATATGCSAADDGAADDENAETQLTSEKSDALSSTPWKTTASGSSNGQVVHKTFGTAGNVVIAFGGYTAKTAYVERWVDELARQKLAGEGFSEIYAVPGPLTAGYSGELRSSDQKIVSDLTGGLAAKAKSIVVIAHSSGTYVANEFIGQVVSASKDAASKISYFVLDGGGVSAANMAATSQTFFVWAHDGKNGMYSHNASGMQSLASTYKKYGGGEQVDATGAGCNPGATWCMHDGLITNRPHNPNTFDLADDYTDFSGSRAVQTSYLNGLGNCGQSTKLVCAPVGGLLSMDAGDGVGQGN